MRLMITGAGGMTGAEASRQASERGWDVAAFTREDLDITDRSAVETAARNFAPGVILNAAAYTAVDAAESDEATATLVNGVGAGNIAIAAAALDAAVIHLSTDYVFDGSSRSPYAPSHPANPLNAYGRSKLAGELSVRSRCDRHLILRTSWVYSHEGRNFLRTMLRLGAERAKLTVVADQSGSPTSAADLARAALSAAERMNNDGAIHGTYHFSNSGVTTWYDFAKEIFDLDGRSNPAVTPIDSDQYPTPAKRPLWSVLDCASFERDFGISPRPWRAALAEVVERVQ